jgi:hypothetical protein
VARRINPAGRISPPTGKFGISVDLAMECALWLVSTHKDLYGWIWLHLWRNSDIFDHWQLIKEPAVLIGMDGIGLLDDFIIDYRRHEIQLHPRGSY